MAEEGYVLVDKFVAYLWGIETTVEAELKQLNDKFVAYLWGIETKVLVAVRTCLMSL